MGAEFERRLRVLVTAVALLAAGCGGGGGGAGGAGSGEEVFSADGIHFPFDAGDRWLYGPPSGGSLVLQKSGGTRSVPGATARAMQSVNLADGSRSTSYYSADGSGVREHLPDAVDPVSRALDGLYVVRWPANAGDSFVLLDRTVDIGEDYDGDGRSELVALRMDLQVIGRESVDTPAGRFADAARQRLTLRQTLLPTGGSAPIAIVAVNESWFAPGIGLVRNSVSVRGAGLDEDVSSVLSGYRVGTRTTDSTPPAVLTSSPGAGTVAALTAVVSATFDEPLDPDSVTSEAIALRDAGGSLMAGFAELRGRTISFQPRQGWFSGRHTATIDASVTDLLGNPLPQPHAWQFDVDASGPAIVSTEPAIDAVDVPLDTPIVIRFAEPPNPATVRPDTVTLRALDSNYTPVPASLSVSGTVVTLTPSAPLRTATTYEVDVYGIADELGNQVGTPMRWVFRTVQGRFSYPQSLTTDDYRFASAIGDINGDGLNDVLLAGMSASNLKSRIQARLGRPDGTLADTVTLPLDAQLACYLDALAIGDLNGDGRNDVVAGGSNCGAQILLQAADGALVPDAVLPQEVGRLRIADLDADGRLDLMGIVTSQDHALLWRQGTDGRLEPPRSVPIGHAGDIAIADVDGNGRPDLVVNYPGAYDADVAVIYQRADGSFQAPVNLSTGGVWRASSVAAGDFNGDGRMDIAVTTGGNSPTEIAVFHQAAGGTFGTPTRLPTYDSPAAVRAADLDGDGRLDLVVGHASWLAVGVYMQAADGRLSAEERYAAPYGNFNPEVLAVGDVNRDGRPDIVVDGHVLLQRAAPAPTAGTAVRAGLGAGHWREALRSRWSAR